MKLRKQALQLELHQSYGFLETHQSTECINKNQFIH